MDIVGAVLLFLAQASVAFVVSTLLFDALHYLLHRWQASRFQLLRTFSSWHFVHHKFLNFDMKIDPRYRVQNIWLHIVPEYVTSMAGTAAFLLVFPWPPVAAVAAVRTVLFAITLKQEGMDINHMSMDRVGARQNIFWIDQNYHAMHHLYPNNYFSSFVNLFDLILGRSCQFEGRRFLVTGASGAFGQAIVKKLEARGAVVETAKSGVDFGPGDYERMRDKLERAEVLVLAHGAKSQDCWNANVITFIGLIELFREIGRSRLAPPEIWGLGSEVELHGDWGMQSLRAYSVTKRAFAARAVGYYESNDILYRHIVPSAFTSRMGPGWMSADVAAAIALFFIRRGFKYVPVTLTTMAYWNYLRFRFFQRREAGLPDFGSAAT